MDLSFSKRSRLIFGSLLLAVIFLVAIIFGSNSGKAEADAATVYSAAQSAVNALQNFYSDQNRYPTPTELADQNTMLNYLTAFPLPNLPDKNCAQSFVYKRPTAGSFQLEFCLAAATGGYASGWNVINGSPPALGN